MEKRILSKYSLILIHNGKNYPIISDVSLFDVYKITTKYDSRRSLMIGEGKKFNLDPTYQLDLEAKIIKGNDKNIGIKFLYSHDKDALNCNYIESKLSKYRSDYTLLKNLLNEFKELDFMRGTISNIYNLLYFNESISELNLEIDRFFKFILNSDKLTIKAYFFFKQQEEPKKEEDFIPISDEEFGDPFGDKLKNIEELNLLKQEIIFTHPDREELIDQKLINKINKPETERQTIIRMAEEGDLEQLYNLFDLEEIENILGNVEKIASTSKRH
ncbi:MAG: hypothetical protein PHQ89_00845 [Bacilli bacterium]|nr:hypothetical protein [Bacilli bacterium]